MHIAQEDCSNMLFEQAGVPSQGSGKFTEKGIGGSEPTMWPLCSHKILVLRHLSFGITSRIMYIHAIIG
jgi:hypothetical protein